MLVVLRVVCGLVGLSGQFFMLIDVDLRPMLDPVKKAHEQGK
jgi:hypothetical protein